MNPAPAPCHTGYHRIGGDNLKRRSLKPKRRTGSEAKHVQKRWREIRAARRD